MLSSTDETIANKKYARTNRDRIAYLRNTYPERTMTSIAKEVGVSRQRVHQVLQQEGLPTKSFRTLSIGYCQICEKPYPELLSRYPKAHKECRLAANRVTVRCNYCGEPKEITLGLYYRAVNGYETKQGIKYKGDFYCDKQHQGRWLAEQYGFNSVRRDNHGNWR